MDLAIPELPSLRLSDGPTQSLTGFQSNFGLVGVQSFSRGESLRRGGGGRGRGRDGGTHLSLRGWESGFKRSLHGFQEVFVPWIPFTVSPPLNANPNLTALNGDSGSVE